MAITETKMSENITGLQRESVILKYEVHCPKCLRVERIWGSFHRFNEIDLADFESSAYRTLERTGWFRSGADWLCARHK